MRNSEWTKILGWPGYRVYQHEIDERAKTLRLWVRRKSGNRKLVCSGCGRRVSEIHEVYEREVRDPACFEFRTTVVSELYRIRCPECGIRTERVEQLPSKARFSKSRWKNLASKQRGELNRLFQLNRRVFQAYLLNESLERLWDYRYEGAMLNYPQKWMDQLKWQRLRPFEKLADMLLNHLEGILNYCRTKVPIGMVEALNGY